MEHMKRCAWCNQPSGLEWHHALQYSNKQVDEWYAIIALCTKCHRGEFGTLRREIKEYCELLAITRGVKELPVKYAKRDWLWEKHWLENRIKNYVNERKI